MPSLAACPDLSVTLVPSSRLQPSTVARGWGEVVFIEDDLGRSGAGVHRPGFERLLTALCEGIVGAVFCIEPSRLARNGRDWQTLLEFSRLVDALIVDADGVYTIRVSPTIACCSG